MAQVVIVGGGIVGAGIAYHLAVEHGWDGIVVIDQGELPYNVGSTSHAPGGVVIASHSKLMAEMALYSSRLYRRLDPIDDKHINCFALGGLELARSEARGHDLRRLHGACKSFGIATHLLSPHETVERLDFMDPAALAGSLFVEESALVRGYHIVGDLLSKSGALTLPHTALDEIEMAGGRIAAVTTSNPEHPRIETELVVIAANIWSPALTRGFGMEIPLRAFQHQYVIGPRLSGWAGFDRSDLLGENTYPLIRDLDAAMYYRQHWDQLGIGSYHHDPHMVRSEHVGASAMREFTPEDFVEAWELAKELVPELRGAEPQFDTAYNGMFAFSVDGYPIIGESKHLPGLWSANASWITHAGGVAKSVAEWIVTGTTEWDMRQAHLYRFQDYATTQAFVDTVTKKNYREVYDIVHPRQPITEPRNVRLSPFHARQVAADAVFTAFAGLELPNWYESNAVLVEEHTDQIPARNGWEAGWWSPIAAAEHLAARDRAGLWDLTGLSIIEVSGPGAPEFVNELCSNDMSSPAGSVTYTCWLTPGGGIKRDLAVARMARNRFWMFVGEGTVGMDLHWVETHAPPSVVVTNISGAYSALGIFGPAARDILGSVTPADLGNEAFPYYSGQWIDVGVARVYAVRLSYVGELGWELHIPVDSSLAVWDALVAAGEPHGLILAGMAAMDTMRIEKGYRLWGADIHTEYDLVEAGLGWTAKLNKASFIGRDSAAAAKVKTPKKKLVPLRIDDDTAVLMGYEPVGKGEATVGYVTTGNHGYSVGHGVGYAYVPAELAEPGTTLHVEYFARRIPATVVQEPLFDPKGDRMRA